VLFIKYLKVHYKAFSIIFYLYGFHYKEKFIYGEIKCICYKFYYFCKIISACNRTYYGNLGLTYDLELHRPKEDRIPYICVLTFTAAGGHHGDIVQVNAYIY